jgi:hypothetical protein
MLRSLILAGALAFAAPAFAASATPFDTDKDGTVDLTEAQTAASALFDKLDTDHEGTLSPKELKGRISKKDWAVADPDNDKTMSKDEYSAYVAALFKEADADNEGTLDKKELRSAAGRKLVKLMR